MKAVIVVAMSLDGCTPALTVAGDARRPGRAAALPHNPATASVHEAVKVAP